MTLRVRQLVLLAVVVFLLATAVPGTAGTSRPPRRDPQLQPEGPPAYAHLTRGSQTPR